MCFSKLVYSFLFIYFEWYRLKQMWKFGLCCLNCFSRNDLNTTFRRTGKLTYWSLNVVLQLTAIGQIYYSINCGEHIPHFNFSCGDNNNNKITGQKWANAPLCTAIHHIQNLLCKMREATITQTFFLRGNCCLQSSGD